MDDINRLRRFLCTRSERGVCLVKGKQKTVSNLEYDPDDLQLMQHLTRTMPAEDLINEIVRYSAVGRLVHPEPVVFALAVCAKTASNMKLRQAAFDALGDVCMSSTQLFQFLTYCRQLPLSSKDEISKDENSGWGRAKRRAISLWYNQKSAHQLALAVTKCRGRQGWAHIDLLRLAHVRPTNEGATLVMKYVTRGLAQVVKDYANDGLTSELKEVLQYLRDVELVKHSHDEHQVAMLVEKHQLSFEHIPTWMRNSAEVWRSLLLHMPLQELILSLGKISRVGILSATDTNSMAPTVIERLKSDITEESNLHPFAILAAQKAYEKGRLEKNRKIDWKPNPAIVESLSTAFCASFKNIVPTEKRFLMAVDVSGSMQYGSVNGTYQLKPVQAAATILMSIARSEQHYEMLVFSEPMAPAPLNKDMSLQELCHALGDRQQSSVGTMDCALPIIWAMELKKDFDVFLLITDCDTLENTMSPAEALEKYRKVMQKPQARFIVIALTSANFKLSNYDDPGMLDIAGFDVATVSVMRNFIVGDM
ncbi:hypothetical protein CAPTEDRAFT_150806 [Capitella teleta]|uniref:TROVE domain-containing protein n=1 Tax=Capitella teleta TaxID=283909 RepID=R7THM6_CAPTE|nr:hypothetical protein CAPTEDRAFT_150806 [Capitella teleta]|eukprot:ELT92967.1 hypothetical protein CAPTEDRAFT_150806 [Capitella teleta]